MAWAPRERIALGALLALLSAAVLVPIWITRFLPLVDEPNHLSAIYLWHHLSDPRSSLHRFYELSIEPVSYFLHYFLAHEFAWVVGVEAGHKLALCLYVLGLPFAGLWWCRRTGRSPWLSLALFPLPYSYFWAFGFHPFNLGLVAFLIGVIAFDRLCERVTFGRTAFAATCALLCYLSHPIPLAMLGLALPVLLLSWRVRWQSLLASGLALLPSAAMMRWQSQRSATTGVDWKQAAGGTLFTLEPRQWLARLRLFDDFSMNVVAGKRDTQLFHALLIFGALLLLSSLLRRRSEPGTHEPASLRWLRAHRSAALALVMLAGYLVLPEGFAGQVGILYVSGRIAPAVSLFFLLAPAIRAADPRRFLALASVPITLLLVLEIGSRYQQFARYMQPLPELLAQCSPDADVLTINMPPHALPQVSELAPFRLLPAWVQVVHGGYAPDAWDRPIPFPFRVTHPLPAPSWLDPRPQPEFLNAPYRCLFAHQLTSALPGRGWRLAAQRGPWTLYRRK